ncbi:MAG: transposase [Deltaproteobacteria bacterium]|nr:transposase [Deltaproteobacteria bacterium]
MERRGGVYRVLRSRSCGGSRNTDRPRVSGPRRGTSCRCRSPGRRCRWRSRCQSSSERGPSHPAAVHESRVQHVPRYTRCHRASTARTVGPPQSVLQVDVQAVFEAALRTEHRVAANLEAIRAWVEPLPLEDRARVVEVRGLDLGRPVILVELDLRQDRAEHRLTLLGAVAGAAEHREHPGGDARLAGRHDEREPVEIVLRVDARESVARVGLRLRGRLVRVDLGLGPLGLALGAGRRRYSCSAARGARGEAAVVAKPAPAGSAGDSPSASSATARASGWSISTPATTRSPRPGDAAAPAASRTRRRKVFEAKENPDALLALDIIRDIYVVEHDACAAGCERTDKHLQMRRERTRPLMARLLSWARRQRRTATPKSPVGTAAGYIVRNRRALTRFLSVAALLPDNNRSEAALRRVALARRAHALATRTSPLRRGLGSAADFRERARDVLALLDEAGLAVPRAIRRGLPLDEAARLGERKRELGDELLRREAPDAGLVDRDERPIFKLGDRGGEALGLELLAGLVLPRGRLGHGVLRGRSALHRERLLVRHEQREIVLAALVEDDREVHDGIFLYRPVLRDGDLDVVVVELARETIDLLVEILDALRELDERDEQLLRVRPDAAPLELRRIEGDLVLADEGREVLGERLVAEALLTAHQLVPEVLHLGDGVADVLRQRARARDGLLRLLAALVHLAEQTAEHEADERGERDVQAPLLRDAVALLDDLVLVDLDRLLDGSDLHGLGRRRRRRERRRHRRGHERRAGLREHLRRRYAAMHRWRREGERILRRARNGRHRARGAHAAEARLQVDLRLLRLLAVVRATGGFCVRHWSPLRVMSRQDEAGERGR